MKLYIQRTYIKLQAGCCCCCGVDVAVGCPSCCSCSSCCSCCSCCPCCPSPPALHDAAASTLAFTASSLARVFSPASTAHRCMIESVLHSTNRRPASRNMKMIFYTLKPPKPHPTPPNMRYLPYSSFALVIFAFVILPRVCMVCAVKSNGQ